MLAPLSSHTPVKEPAGKQFDRKPTLLGWQARREPTGRNPKRYGTTATPGPILQSGTYAWSATEALERSCSRPSPHVYAQARFRCALGLTIQCVDSMAYIQIHA